MTVSFFVATLGQVLTLAIIIRAVLSWFPPSRMLAPVTTFLNDATDPLLRPIQRKLPTPGGLDLSPLVAILLIGVVQAILLSLLAGH
jgi:YggT family protein